MSKLSKTDCLRIALLPAIVVIASACRIPQPGVSRVVFRAPGIPEGKLQVIVLRWGGEELVESRASRIGKNIVSALGSLNQTMKNRGLSPERFIVSRPGSGSEYEVCLSSAGWFRPITSGDRTDVTPGRELPIMTVTNADCKALGS